MATVSFNVMVAMVISTILARYADNKEIVSFPGRDLRGTVNDADIWRMPAESRRRDYITRNVSDEDAMVAPSFVQTIKLYTILLRGADTDAGSSETSDGVPGQRTIREENQEGSNDDLEAPKGSWRKNHMRVWG